MTRKRAMENAVAHGGGDYDHTGEMSLTAIASRAYDLGRLAGLKEYARLRRRGMESYEIWDRIIALGKRLKGSK